MESGRLALILLLFSVAVICVFFFPKEDYWSVVIYDVELLDLATIFSSRKKIIGSTELIFPVAINHFLNKFAIKRLVRCSFRKETEGV